MESQPQKPEFRNYPENFHPWVLARLVHLITQPTCLPYTDANTVALQLFQIPKLKRFFLSTKSIQMCLYLTFDIVFFFE